MAGSGTDTVNESIVLAIPKLRQFARRVLELLEVKLKIRTPADQRAIVSVSPKGLEPEYKNRL